MCIKQTVERQLKVLKLFIMHIYIDKAYPLILHTSHLEVA